MPQLNALMNPSESSFEQHILRGFLRRTEPDESIVGWREIARCRQNKKGEPEIELRNEVDNPANDARYAKHSIGKDNKIMGLNTQVDQSKQHRFRPEGWSLSLATGSTT